ncbi:hypothetical protein BMS3Bbin15_01868 [archaeon BMS3Bbin15]|nr:hypothetical protein BMS3Bbin15_01868 [archaeon BMS3Bbin15]
MALGESIVKHIERKSSISIGLTLLIITMLILSGPAAAVSINVSSLPTKIEQGNSLNFILDTNISAGENIPIYNITINVMNSTGNSVGNYTFYQNGTAITSGINVSLITSAPFGYGYRYGYGYAVPLGYQNYTFGYGYGYGNSTSSSKFEYNITITGFSTLSPGNYSLRILVDTGTGNYYTTATVPVVGVSAVSVTPPAVTITKPANGSTVGILNNTFEGSVTAVNGLAAVKLYLNGTLVDSWSSEGNFSRAMNYTSGALNVIKIEAIDNYNNTNVSEVSVYVNQPVVVVNKTVIANTTTTVNGIINTSTEIEFVPAVSGNVLVTLNASTNVSWLDNRTSNTYFSANVSANGRKALNGFVKIELNGTKVNDSNLRYAVVKMYYSFAQLDQNGNGKLDPGDINPAALHIYRFCSATGVWNAIPYNTNATICNGTVTVYNSGVNTTEGFVWANLSRLSLYGMAGSVVPAPTPVIVPVAAPGVTTHEIKIGSIGNITVKAGANVTVGIPLHSASEEPDVNIYLENLPSGWTAEQLKGVTLPLGNSKAEIELMVPENVTGGTYKVLIAVASAWFGKTEQKFNVIVTTPAKKPSKVTPLPPPAKKPSNVTIPPPAKKPSNVTIPPPAKKKGICGPTLIALLAAVPLALRLRRRRRV